MKPSVPTLCLVLVLLAPALAAGQGPDFKAAFDAAVEKLQAEQYSEVISLLEPLRSRPDTPPPLLGMLGLAYVEAGRPAAALEVLAPLAQADNADPAVLYNAGRAAEGVGSLEEADRYFERSVNLVSGTPAARELGILRGRTGRYADALALLRSWVETHPDDTEARLTGAFCAVQLERAPDAETLLSDLPQDLVRVRLLWGKVLLLKGDPYGAIATLKPLAEQTPPEIEVDLRRTMAEAYLLVGQGAEAVKQLEGHTEGRPRMALQLSQARYQSGDLPGALSDLAPLASRALQIQGDDLSGPEAALRGSMVLEYGRLLVAAGRHQDALPYLDLATRIDAGNKLAWQGLGQALAAVGRTQEAQAALEKFRDITSHEVPGVAKDMQLEQDREDPTGRELRRALTLLARDQGEQALTVARTQATLAPADPRPRLIESRILLYLNRPEDALAAAGAALEMQPGNADGHYQRGVVRMGLKDLTGAEADFRQALELAPDHTAAMNDLAVLLMQKGQNAEARELLQRVLEKRPDDPVARANLERAQGG